MIEDFEKDEQIERLQYEVDDLIKKNEKLVFNCEKYRQVFEDSLDIIIIIDGDDGSILEVNDVVSDYLLYHPEELIGKHFKEVFVDVEEQTPGELLKKLKMYGPVLASRYILRKDGTRCPVDLTLNIMNWGSKKVILTNCRDTSERLIAEQEIERYTEKLAKLNATKDRFFSIIAHDLKNLFGALLGFSEILVKEYHDLDDNDRSFFIKRIEKMTKDSYQLLDNLLNWANTQTGNIDFAPSFFDVKRIAWDTITLLKVMADRKDIILEYSFPDDNEVWADPNMISTILRNLIGNAIKYSHRGSKVEIRGTRKENKFLISVKDYGIGMNRERLDQLFRIDVHHSERGTAKEEGNGLGLILCAEFLKMNSGRLKVESEPGGGSNFIFSLPLQPSGKK